MNLINLIKRLITFTFYSLSMTINLIPTLIFLFFYFKFNLERLKDNVRVHKRELVKVLTRQNLVVIFLLCFLCVLLL